ncbi:Tat pathway signal protein [Halorubrum luteum]
MTVPNCESLSRRAYLRAAVAAGGAAGLSACLDGDDGSTTIPAGNPADRPERQHAWNDALRTDDDGNHLQPEHRVLLPLRLRTDLDADARERVEAAFETLERAYDYDAEGLLFTVGYAPAYFDRLDDVDSPVPDPEPLTSMESPAFDAFDAIVHLASDSPAAVLEAERALFGEAEPNGLDPTPIDDVFERAEPRRTGFVGEGIPAEHADRDDVPASIPGEAPFFMGFRSGFAESQAPEDRVTIREGPFAGGTTLHVSSMDLNLRQWFEQDSRFQRVAKTFSPEHADEGVGCIGEKLGRSTGALDVADDAETHARTRGVVGHAQKAARARDDDGTPPLLRRDVNTVDGDAPGLHFIAYQRRIEEFIRVREAMTGADLTEGGVGRRLNNGLLQYILVRRRGNFLVPPRSKRALPEP